MIRKVFIIILLVICVSAINYAYTKTKEAQNLYNEVHKLEEELQSSKELTLKITEEVHSEKSRYEQVKQLTEVNREKLDECKAGK